MSVVKYKRSWLPLLTVAAVILPIATAGGLWLWLHGSATFSDQQLLITCLAAGLGSGLVLALLILRLLTATLNEIKYHLEAILGAQFGHTTNRFAKAGLGPISDLLDQVNDRFQQYTTHNQAELAIITAEANRLKNVINGINDGVLALDKDAHVILFNRAAGKITGFSIEEAAGQPVNQIAPMMHGNSLVITDWLASNEGSDLRTERWENVRLKSKDGKVKSIDAEALYQGTDPNGIRTLITFHDRTPEQELEDMKVDFVALAAHELRTPISVIRGYLEILQQELKDNLTPEHQEFMRKLNVSAAQMSGVINNILHVSRIEHGNLNLKFESVDWLDLVSTTCHELEEKAAVQGKKLLLTLPPQLEPVAADRMSIVEVINNLVDNAIKYSEVGAQISVSVRPVDDMIETVVADQGLGIPENAIDKLFTKFYRSHRTRDSHRGTGLGLYMSKSIVEAHGGTIWVRSKVGQGSVFGFTLPTYAKLKDKHLAVEEGSKIIRGVHGWIKNHSLYRG